MPRLFIAAVLSFLASGCAPRCHVRQVQWFYFDQGSTVTKVQPMTVCDGGVRLSWK